MLFGTAFPLTFAVCRADRDNNTLLLSADERRLPTRYMIVIPVSTGYSVISAVPRWSRRGNQYTNDDLHARHESLRNNTKKSVGNRPEQTSDLVNRLNIRAYRDVQKFPFREFSSGFFLFIYEYITHTHIRRNLTYVETS